jgi:solute:Na+ symporter, SSS family
VAGGVDRVFAAAAQSDRLRFLPEPDAHSVLAWITASLIIVFGSVPQQDVLQRVMSSKDEATAVRSTFLGGIVYFCIASLPIALVSAALVIDGPMVSRLIDDDSQLILPTLILGHTPMAVQILFFGALVSAILSTAAGALLAPAVMLAENVVRPLVKPRDDRGALLVMRFTVAGLAVAVTLMALASSMSIYQLVNESGKVVMVSSFVPLVAGLFWPRANTAGALASIIAGLVVWIGLEIAMPDALVPPSLAGLIASFVAMISVSLLFVRRAHPRS